MGIHYLHLRLKERCFLIPPSINLRPHIAALVATISLDCRQECVKQTACGPDQTLSVKVMLYYTELNWKLILMVAINNSFLCKLILKYLLVKSLHQLKYKSQDYSVAVQLWTVTSQWHPQIAPWSSFPIRQPLALRPDMSVMMVTFWMGVCWGLVHPVVSGYRKPQCVYVSEALSNKYYQKQRGESVLSSVFFDHVFSQLFRVLLLLWVIPEMVKWCSQRRSLWAWLHTHVTQGMSSLV